MFTLKVDLAFTTNSAMCPVDSDLLEDAATNILSYSNLDDHRIQHVINETLVALLEFAKFYKLNLFEKMVSSINDLAFCGFKSSLKVTILSSFRLFETSLSNIGIHDSTKVN